MYTRLLRLHEVEVSDRTSSTEPTGGAHEQLLRGYDGDLRNQIRQASRRQVTARIVTPRNDAEALEVYTTYLPIHQASWRRTGLAPHGIDYLLGLESAVQIGRFEVQKARLQRLPTIDAVASYVEPDGRVEGYVLAD